MKDVTKLKIWPHLKDEGFSHKDYKIGGVTFGRGALLISNINQYPKIEIEPLLNGHWRLTIDRDTSGTVWEKNAFELSKMLPNEIDKFKNKII